MMIGGNSIRSEGKRKGMRGKTGEREQRTASRKRIRDGIRGVRDKKLHQMMKMEGVGEQKSGKEAVREWR